MNNKIFRVKVPATSANFGSGFDTVGAAFQMYNTFEFSEINTNKLIIEGCEPQYQTEENLVYQSMQKVFEKTGYSPEGIHIKEHNTVPIGKGLGSSATCIVGGLVGANMIAGSPLSKTELWKTAVEMEGHPDNVTPAFFGGLTAALMSGEKTIYTSEAISSRFNFYGCIPDFMLPTEEARAILPNNYTKADVVYNISHVLLTYLSLVSGNEDFIPLAIGDKVHEPYRRSLIPGIDAVEEALKKAGGLASYISGAGPTIMLISSESNTEFEAQMRLFMKENLPQWEFTRLIPDIAGVECEELSNV